MRILKQKGKTKQIFEYKRWFLYVFHHISSFYILLLNTFGKGAGFVRNNLMAEYAEACIVIYDGKSNGSKHMVSAAKKQGLELFVKFVK